MLARSSRPPQDSHLNGVRIRFAQSILYNFAICDLQPFADMLPFKLAVYSHRLGGGNAIRNVAYNGLASVILLFGLPMGFLSEAKPI
jgi:hypothetical protein